MSNNLKTLGAERGYIYEWSNPDNVNAKNNYCVVVSSNDRSLDNLVSILFISTFRNSGKDVIAFKLNGETKCVHADLVTYTARKFLVRKVGKVSKDVMSKIDLRLAQSFGLHREDMIYEKLYKDLLENIVRGN